MDTHEVQSSRQQFNDMLINVRNEMIVQAANLYLFGRQVALTTVGVAALGVDEVQTLLQAALERGEIAEADVQKTLDDIRQRAVDQTKEADRARIEMTENATLALKENVATISKYLGVPGARGPEKEK